MSPVVLILESSPELRRMLEDGLERSGYGVTTASDPDEAISVMREGRVDLVVADPPGPDASSGARMLDRIREEFPDVPAILFSPDAFDPESLIGDGMERSRRRLLRRPFTLGELLGMVRGMTSGPDLGDRGV